MKKLGFLIFCSFSMLFSKAQVIDWASYYGPENSGLYQLTEDRFGNLYGVLTVSGSIEQTEYMNSFITSGAFYSYHDDSQSLFFKLSPEGEVLWSSFFPGVITDISLSSDEQSLYLSGNASLNSDLIASEDVPFPDPYEFGEDEILEGFLMKFDANGQKIWGTYLPVANYTATDEDGNVYVSGQTSLPNIFGSEGVFEQNFLYVYNDSGWFPNTYLLKMNPEGQIIWSTYNGFGIILTIAAKNNEVYIGGHSAEYSPINYFATTGAFASGYTNGAFLSKFNAEGQRIWSTYYGDGQNPDWIDKIKITSENKILIAGYTRSTVNIASAGTFRENIGGTNDYFLAQFDTVGNRDWGTYYGGSEEVNGFPEDGHPVTSLNIMDTTDNYIYVSGFTNATNGISTENGLNTSISGSYNNMDTFINIFDHQGNRLQGTYYGGTNNEFDNGIITSKTDGVFYHFGVTLSTNGISTSNGSYPEFNYSPDSNHAEAYNGFLVKFGNNLNTTEIADSDEIILFPNPNNGRFTLIGTVLGKEEFKMQLFDFSGKLLISRNLGLYEEQHFDYSSYLKSGTYVVKLQSESSDIEKTFKIIVK